jgi:hypothetical protein
MLISKFGQRRLSGCLRRLRDGKMDDELGLELQDMIGDDAINSASTVWTASIRGGEELFPVHVQEYGGLYWVWAMDYDRVGFFTGLQSAIDYVYFDWRDIVDPAHHLQLTRAPADLV